LTHFFGFSPGPFRSFGLGPITFEKGHFDREGILVRPWGFFRFQRAIRMATAIDWLSRPTSGNDSSPLNSAVVFSKWCER